MLKALLVAIALTVFFPLAVKAQTAPTKVELSKGKLQWNWIGPLGSATEFHIKCGPSIGVFSIVKIMLIPTTPPPPGPYSQVLTLILPSSGTYHCTTTAALLDTINGQPVTLESNPSNDVFFSALGVPSGTTNNQIVTQ